MGARSIALTILSAVLMMTTAAALDPAGLTDAPGVGAGSPAVPDIGHDRYHDRHHDQHHDEALELDDDVVELFTQGQVGDLQVVPEVALGFFLHTLAPAVAPTAIEFGPGDADGPDLYATLLTGQVLRYELTWTPATPLLTGISIEADGFSGPLGIAFDDDGSMIVADSHSSSDDAAAAGRSMGRLTHIDAATGTATIIVDGLPQGQHNVNHLRFGPDGRLYLANGNPNDHGNGTGSGQSDIFPYSGAFLSVDIDEVVASPAELHWVDANGDRIADGDLVDHALNQDFADKVDVFAYGFRNIFGIAFAPDHLPYAGAAFTATNGADEPSSQDVVYRITEGAHHGFPFCYDVGEAGAASGAGDVIDKVVAPDTPDTTFPCDDKPVATALLGWHICATGLDLPPEPTGPAPLGVGFVAEYASSLYVAECGPFFANDLVDKTVTEGLSTHNTGHKIARVALDATGDATGVTDFVTGLALPTDARFGPDGALYIADAGAIYRVGAVPDAGPGPYTTEGGPTVTVPLLAVGQSFVTPVLVVPAGTTVQWQGGVLAHTVTTTDEPCAPFVAPQACTANDPLNDDDTADTFNLFVPGVLGTASHTFVEPGTYPYYCQFHYQIGMVGMVVVV